jgi:TonB family protein
MVQLDMPDWKTCEGLLLDAQYPLERYVSGDEASATFVAFASTAIRIRRVDYVKAEALVERWNRVKLLRHPHLVEIDAAGASVLGGEPVAYLVMEFAEENLAEILENRPLTPDETRDMLLQVASALDYLHSQGMSHRDLKASNILAIGDTVRLYSESFGVGDPAADIRALGSTLIYALTQRSEALTHDPLDAARNLPAPFAEIATGCLNPDPSLRWTAKKIIDRLQSPLPAPREHAAASVIAKPGLRRLAVPIGLAAVAVLVLAGVALRRSNAPSPTVVQPRVETAAVAPGPPPAPTPAAPAPKTVTPPPSTAKTQTRDRQAVEDGIARRVVPNVPARARSTIDGKPAVVVRVTVNATGDVTQAVVERSFSPYFSKFALEAARQWKFTPVEGAASRQWILRFQFTKTNADVVARSTSR